MPKNSSLQTRNRKQHKYLWQVGEVKAVVIVWATGSRPPNSFSCCYGYWGEGKKHLLMQHNERKSLQTRVFNQPRQKNTINLWTRAIDCVEENNAKSNDNCVYT